jgi:hypothetical protein
VPAPYQVSFSARRRPASSGVVREPEVSDRSRTDLAPHLIGNEIVASIDILPDAYAFVTSGAASGTPAYRVTLIDTPRAELDAAVARAASAGRVVTALSASPTAGLIRAYLAAQVTTLAAGGYILTGFGRVGDARARRVADPAHHGPELQATDVRPVGLPAVPSTL